MGVDQLTTVAIPLCYDNVSNALSDMLNWYGWRVNCDKKHQGEKEENSYMQLVNKATLNVSCNERKCFHTPQQTHFWRHLHSDLRNRLVLVLQAGVP